MNQTSKNQPTPPVDRETMKEMLQIEMDQIANRYWEEHGVSIAVSSHVMFGDNTGSFGCSYFQDKPSDLVFNLVYMAASNFGMLREMGVPPEIVGRILATFSDEEGVWTQLRVAMDT